MTNHLFLSAASLTKTLDQLNIEYVENMPVIGDVRVSLKELRFGEDQIIVPVHTQVPLAREFDITLRDFRSGGKAIILRMDHVGVIPSPLISAAGCVVKALFGKALKRASVEVAGDQVTVDFNDHLPPFLTDLNIVSVIVRDGIEITFDY